MAQRSRVTPRWHLSGQDLCRLMRRHRVTIRALAQRMDIPMTRIRGIAVSMADPGLAHPA